MIKYTGQLKDYKFNIERIRIHHKSKDGSIGNYKSFCNSILTFDIETTSAWINEGKIIPYEIGKPSEYWNNLQPLALCYLWQCSCDGTVYYGRDLIDFLNLLDDLPKQINIIIWVHNLSYEFQFLCNILTWKSVFARSAHKPMKCTSNEYPNIEFRCTYMLTRLSLDDWGKQIGLHKKVGDLDYEKLRTPLTPLTDIELGYGERDCLVVESGIKTYIKRYGKQRNIPLTQTGTVRQEVKNRLMNDSKYVRFIKDLVPRNAEEYKRLQRVFAGGYTHANRWYAGETIVDEIEHYDFASSYPTVMIAEKYPISPWVYTTSKEIPTDDKFNDWAFILHLKFTQVNTQKYNTYIQASKAYVKNGKFDNGRVISADELEIWITEQDWITIKNNYTWESVEVLHLYKSLKEYLPKAFIEYILELYKNKTELKDVEGMEDIYLQAKQYINALFGMSVTAIVQANINLAGDEWITEKLTEDYVNKKLNSLRFHNPREKRYFLSYSWGCWVTAYARRNLWKCIETVDDELLYCDTDSIFVIGKHDFTWYNKEIISKLQKTCDYYNIDFTLTHPKTPKGKEKQLGIFDKESNCMEFRTLGAKRYVERRVDGKLYLTVSGINKSAVDLLNNDINNFTDGFNFDKDADCVTKRLSTYVYDMPTVQYPDGYISTYKYGINMRRNGYKLTMTDEYKELIHFMEYSDEYLTEQFMTSMRGRFTLEKERQ